MGITKEKERKANERKMIVDTKQLKKLPSVMSKEQFCKFCHISKRMAEYVLTSGLVKCEHTDKKTHSYRIRKEDVIRFVKDRSENPSKYIIPPDKDKRKRETQTVRVMLDSLDRDKARPYYEKLMSNDTEVLDAAYVSRMTGYAHKTVLRWVNTRRLGYFCKQGSKYLFSKENILDFLASDYYNNICAKSWLHIRHLNNIKKAE